MGVILNEPVPQESVELALNLFDRIRKNVHKPYSFIGNILVLEVLFKDIGDEFLFQLLDLKPTTLDWINSNLKDMCLGMFLEYDRIVFLVTEKDCLSHRDDLFRFIYKKRIENWVNALESNTYEQGFEGLIDGNRFCALGVACEISGLGSWDGLGWYSDELETSGDNCLLPEFVRLYYGFDKEDPEITYEDRKIPISVLNDNLRLSFEEIANLIKKQFDL